MKQELEESEAYFDSSYRVEREVLCGHYWRADSIRQGEERKYHGPISELVEVR